MARQLLQRLALALTRGCRDGTLHELHLGEPVNTSATSPSTTIELYKHALGGS